MQGNTQPKDFRTPGIVLRRTNYGEADRILNIITPGGKISTIAKGARKEKSKLAGGIEMFSLIDLNIHQGKNDLALITGAKTTKFYQNIIKDFSKIELASVFLKEINRVSENSDNKDFFEILRQSLEELDNNTSLSLIESWFLLNITKAVGEEINLYRDINGEKLSAEEKYEWDVYESVFFTNDDGSFGANEIKMLRLITTTNLSTVKKVKMGDSFLTEILRLSRIVAKK